MAAVGRRVSLFAFVALGLVAAAALVVVLAPRASSAPDGLEKVAADTGIDADARPHLLADGPFADYGTRGVEHSALGTAVAGLVGVAVTFVVCLALVLLVRRRRVAPGSSGAPLGAPPPG
jgi:hypothetical protein